ncbi:MAG: hypothetical protein DHS20C01_18570 [marine bacterium B5-7]|nr:MAG: hypothetical protein DHS20C01_18570 [marine bacterium B5-7]
MLVVFIAPAAPPTYAQNNFDLYPAELYLLAIEAVLNTYETDPSRIPETCQPVADALKYHHEQINDLENKVRNATDTNKKEILQLDLEKVESGLEKVWINWLKCIFNHTEIVSIPAELQKKFGSVSPTGSYLPSEALFVSTRCKKSFECVEKAEKINNWVGQNVDEFHNFSIDELPKERAKRVKRQNEFLNELTNRKAELEALETKFCPDLKQLPILNQADANADQRIQVWIHFNKRTGDLEYKVSPESLKKYWQEQGALDDEFKIEVEYNPDKIFSDALKSLKTPTDPPNDTAIKADKKLKNGLSASYRYEFFTHGFTPSEKGSKPEDNKTGETGKARSTQMPANPSDTYFSSTGSIRDGLEDQWGLSTIGFSIKGSGLWPEQASPTIVAIIDSGLDLTHPDLRNRIWINTEEIADNALDDDDNGIVDDVYGWNFVSDNNNTQDANGHGTLVAGIIGATTDNGIGIAGINPWAKLLPIKVTNYQGNGNSVDLAAAIGYAVSMGARVINVSLGGEEFSEVEYDAVRFANDNGVLVVVAAGNQAKDTAEFWPAGLNGVVTVAAVSAGNTHARYSNWGDAVDIVAPGSEILSLRARHTDPMIFADDNYSPGSNIVGPERILYHATGTSFAAPHVAGVASLLFSINPKLTATQVKRMILQSARDIETPGVDQFTGYGLLDAAAALSADPRFFIESSIDGVELVSSGKAIRVLGSALADKFKSAVVELGKGDTPSKWKSVGSKITQPVSNGILVDIETRNFKGAKQWTLRLTTRHENGKKREVRFLLTLG